jgi:hypothetical protein
MYIESSLVINKDVYETIKDFTMCSICTGIVCDPHQCQICQIGFCKACIEEWVSKSNTCPFKCTNSTIRESRIIRNIVSKLVFKCPWDCKEELTYEKFLIHEDMCEKQITQCPCCKLDVQKNILPKVLRGKKTYPTYEELFLENEELKKKLGSKLVDLYFINGLKVFETPSGSSIRTFSCKSPLPKSFSINIKFIKVAYPGHLVIGFSDKIFSGETKGYLGGDLGLGNWGVAGNGSIGQEGKWIKGTGFKQGDIVTFSSTKSVISYAVNQVPSGYSYDLKKKPLYLTFSFYYPNEKIEILS